MAVSKEKWKVYGNVFDEFTNKTLFKLSAQGAFDELVGPISIGKESNVFLAKRNRGYVIVKIYRILACDFNRMYDYIRSDPRYWYLRKQKRKIILAWAQREYRNLLRARSASVRVPKPIAVLNNVLVLDLIGKNGLPASKLKDSYPKSPNKFFKDVIGNVKKLYKTNLVHADLSSFNILNFNEKPVFIDFSQATDLKDVMAVSYLRRDLMNIVRFFKKKGLKTDYNSILVDIQKV